MTMYLDTQHTNYPFVLDGDSFVEPAATLLQDATRATAMAVYTVLAKNTSGKYIPLTNVNPTLTPAIMLTGTNGSLIAAWKAVTDGEFSITVDGTVVNITGLDFSSITTLEEITDTVNYAAAAYGFYVVYDSKANKFKFVTTGLGLPHSITVLSAVSGGTGTNIAGASGGFFNALTGAGAVTAATGSPATGIPAGILLRPLTAAQIAAADVSNVPVVVGGAGLVLDKNQIVLENSLALTSIVYANGKNKSIADCLIELGVFTRDVVAEDEFENS